VAVPNGSALDEMLNAKVGPASRQKSQNGVKEPALASGLMSGDAFTWTSQILS
jgi:hypothetical protein